MTDPHDAAQPDLAALTPATAGQLLAMQEAQPAPGTKVELVLDYINRLDTSALDDQQIARAIVRQLELLHKEVAAELRADRNGSPAQIAGWAVDADRLQHCRILLDSISLD